VLVTRTTGASNLLGPQTNDLIIHFDAVCSELSKAINSVLTKDGDIIKEFNKNILLKPPFDFYATFSI
jgi:hypothetical protein